MSEDQHTGTNRPPAHLAPYRKLLEQHGAGFAATGWINPDAQRTRFRVLTECVDLTGTTILDAGAGQGDLAVYLKEQGIQCAKCVALDAMPEMVEKCNALGIDWLEAHTSDFAEEADAFTRFGSFDAIFFSGSLNTLTPAHAQAVLERAWASKPRAMVFNFLTDRCRPELLGIDTTPARRFDTLTLIDWGLSQTHRMLFRQAYLDGHDATIAMFAPCSKPTTPKKQDDRT